MRKIYFILIFLCFSGGGAVAGVATGKVDTYISNNLGKFFFLLNTAVQNKPGCSANGRFVLDTNTQFGRDMKNEIINAKNWNLDVLAAGTGTCNVWPDSEDISYLLISGTPGNGQEKVVYDTPVCVSASCPSNCRLVGQAPCVIASTPTHGSCSITDVTKYGFGSCCMCAP